LRAVHSGRTWPLRVLCEKQGGGIHLPLPGEGFMNHERQCGWWETPLLCPKDYVEVALNS